MSDAPAAAQGDAARSEDSALASRLAAVDRRIAEAAARGGRDPGEITRIVVTKFHPVTLIERLHRLGVRHVGENRVQELAEKIETAQFDTAQFDTSDASGLRWHAIGQVQTNKARQVAAAAASVPLVLHSLDRVRLADALDTALQTASEAAGNPLVLDTLVQLNLTDDPGRGGAPETELVALAEHAESLPHLRVRGVMAVAPLDVEPAAAFARVAEASTRLRALLPDATWISAGMSADLEDAVAHGATHLRIGTAITGSRPDRG